MTLDKDDKKEMRSIMTEVVGTALEQIVLHRLQDLDEKTEKIDERFDDVDASLNRIETLAKSEIKYVDDLSKRVGVLEAKKV